MKNARLLKALTIIIPIIVAIFAQYYENKQLRRLHIYYKADCIIESSVKTD